MFEAMISIDLGASYTKVAYRSACDSGPHRYASQDASIMVLDGSPLIPSLAIRTGRTQQPWLFGQQAANLKPGPGMTVFKNWKANLFRPTNDGESAQAVIVAEQFFSWLKQRIEETGLDLGCTHVRISLPAFDDCSVQASILAQCMSLSGWNAPCILQAAEPHGNALGLFSEGRNVVCAKKSVKELHLNYGRMFSFSSSWIKKAREYILSSGKRTFDVAFMDIGAFTTDVASLTFDLARHDSSGDGLMKIRQQSYPHGVINDLDLPLFEDLCKRHHFQMTELSFMEHEQAKTALYNGKSHALLTKSAGEVNLGDVHDTQIVRKHVKEFTTILWAHVTKFLAEENPYEIHLTGGGALISPVAQMLEESLRAQHIMVKQVKEGASCSGDNPWRPWNNTGQGMHRLATALGGASVILQVPSPAVPDAPNASRGQIAGTPGVSRNAAKIVSCCCAGRNRDCCFCGGRGYYNQH